MNNLINTYRRRILKAALLRHQRKTGSTCIIINMPNGAHYCHVGVKGD